jgi:phosphomannomutase
MITASHSPANYNGLKLVMPGAVPLTKPTGLNAILKRIKGGKFSEPKRKGKRQGKYVGEMYCNYILKKIKTKNFDNLSIVADVGNGMAGVLMPLLENKLPIKFKTILGELDGRFPNRDSDPTGRKNQKFLVKELKTGQYDFGIAFDGDADRIAFLDNKGKYVNCAVIGSLIAERILKDEPGSKHVFTNLTSRVYEESIVGSGGKAVRARVGHAFLKRKMHDTKAVFGCEHSGHFFFRDFFYTDSVVLTFIYVAQVYLEAKKEGKSFEEMVSPYRKYEQLEDVVIDVKDKKKSIQKVLRFVKKQYPEAVVKEFDGLYIKTEKAWGAVKPSVTEHAIKIMFEGLKKKDASQVQDKLVAYVRKIAKE